MFTQILELFLSKLVELTADNAVNDVKSIKDFELNLRTLLKNLKSLIAKACDVEEEIKNAELSGRKKRKREVEEWLEEVKSIEEVVELGSRVESQGFIMRLMNGGTAAELNDEVDKLVEQSRHFGELVLDVCGARAEALLTNGMVGEAFDRNLESILKLLESRQVSRIGVYGMGGVGKTALAKHVHNRLLKQSETRVFWITVSQEFSIKSLQDNIARFLGIDLLDEVNEDLRAARLHRALSQMKKSVLILDDVWEKIDMIKVGCPVSVECCRLIITTRSLEVCRQSRCQQVIQVEALHEDEAWKLFKETLGNENELSCQVEEIAKAMVILCGGLPLGIITLAGSMTGESAIHAWKNAFVELKERIAWNDGMGEDDVFKVLKYSFDQLNKNNQSKSNEFNTFQRCFLYCSFYPEDEEILREDLVRKFISEGLVEQRKSLRAQVEQGHSILDKLVNVCLLERCDIFFPNDCVKMHDLVRGMALNIGNGKYMVRAGDWSSKEILDEEDWTQGLEKVSLMKSGIRRIGDGVSPNCPNLSTLLLCWNWLDIIPDSFFSKMQHLCTLDLSHTNIRLLPDSICGMKSLKALLIEHCRMLETIPYLGKLSALRELNLSHTAITEVPRGVEELLNLKVLSLYAPQLKILPRGLFVKLVHLQHLNIPLYIQLAMEEIENLKELEEFRGGVESVNDFNSFIRGRVHDTFYVIQVRALDTTVREGEIEYCSNKLILCELNLQDEKVLGQGIRDLTIRRCEGLSKCFVDDLSRLNNPTSLERLEISRCGGIEWISRSEEGLPSPFSNTLERIELLELKDLKGLIWKGEIGTSATFFSLGWLNIVGCNKMRKLGLPLRAAPNLGFIEISNSAEIEEIFEDEGRGSSVTLPKFKRLILKELPKLKSVCKETMICNSIEAVVILKCPRLNKKLPVHVDDPPSPTLRFISVEREWWESLEWDNPNLPQLLHPLLSFLS